MKPNQVRTYTFGSIKVDSHILVLIVAVSVYASFFSYLTIQRYLNLQTYAYDLGNYNQALYTTFTHHTLLYYTSDLIADPSGSMFGVSVPAILLLILPFYAIFAAPQTLLVIQSIALGLGAIPVYLLTKRKVGSRNLGLLLSLAYFLSPGLQSINWYDFHPEAFIPTAMLFAMYFYEVRLWRCFFACILLVLTTIETAAIVVISFGLYQVLSLFLKNKETSKVDPSSRKQLAVPLITAVVALAWFILSARIITAFNSSNIYLAGASQYWTVLGAKNLVEIPKQIIISPRSVVAAMIYDWPHKLYYIIALFGPVFFSPLISPGTWVLFLPLAPFILSNYPAFVQLGTQYPAYAIAQVFYASIIAMPSMLRIMRPKRFFIAVSTATAMFLLLSSPLTPWAIGAYPSITYGLPEFSAHSASVNGLVAMVPKDASVLTQNNIFPLLSDRDNAYVVPASVFYPPCTSFAAAFKSILDKVSYILVDSRTDLTSTAIILSQQIVKTNFGILAAADGAYLLKRGYFGPPLFFNPLNISFNYAQVTAYKGVRVVSDPYSIDKNALLHSDNVNTDFWYGPYYYLPPGAYEAIFNLRLQRPVNGDVLQLRVDSFLSTILETVDGNNSTGYHIGLLVNQNGSKLEYANTVITGENFTNAAYNQFTLWFNASYFGAYEFTGLDVKTPTPLYFDQVRIVQVQPQSYFHAEFQVHNDIGLGSDC